MKSYKLYPGAYPTRELTRDNLEIDTQKRQPHFGMRTYQFAVCPCCDNPIIIINMYLSENYYARHYLADVPDLADFNRETYEKCNLKGKQTLSKNKTCLVK